jgi:hypothetical protein
MLYGPYRPEPVTAATALSKAMAVRTELLKTAVLLERFGLRGSLFPYFIASAWARCFVGAEVSETLLADTVPCHAVNALVAPAIPQPSTSITTTVGRRKTQPRDENDGSLDVLNFT